MFPTAINAVVAAAATPFAHTQSGLKALNEDRINNPQKFEQTMIKSIGEWFELQHNALYNPTEKNVAERVKSMQHLYGGRQKASLGSFPGRTIDIYQAFLDELQIDMDWMQAYKMEDLTGTSHAEILDFTSLNGWKEYPHGHDIEMTPWGTEDFSEMREKRHAVGKHIFNRCTR